MILSIITEILNNFVFNFLVGVFIIFPLMLALFFGGIVLFILSVIHIFKKYKATKIKSLFPLLLSTVLLFLVIERPFSPIFQKLEFSLKLDERKKVAGQILKGEIKASDENGDLFPVRKNLSDGNEVLKIGNKLLFFTVRGILDNFAGYVYSPDGSRPTNGDVQANIVEIKKLNKHWYFVSCT